MQYIIFIHNDTESKLLSCNVEILLKDKSVEFYNQTCNEGRARTGLTAYFCINKLPYTRTSLGSVETRSVCLGEPRSNVTTPRNDEIVVVRALFYRALERAKENTLRIPDAESSRRT